MEHAIPLEPSNRSRNTPPQKPGELPFIGRSHELGELSRAVQRAATGTGGLLCFSGESGIGKSRLLAAAREEMLARDGTVTRGEGTIHAGAPPYQIWIEALRRLDERAVPELLIGIEPESALPELHATAEDPARWRFQVAAQVMSELERICKSGPLVMTLDDLQWADSASLDLLHFLAYRVENLPILLVGGFRSQDSTSEVETLVSELAGDHRAIWLPLAPLTAADIEPAIASVIGPTDSTWSSQLVQYSRGNPFVLGETVRALVGDRSNDGQLPVVASLSLPPSVGAAIRARLARLEPEQRRLIDLLAVSGDPIQLDTIAASSDTDPADIDQQLHGLIELALAVTLPSAQQPRFQLVHHWMREVALGLIPQAERQRLHRTLAESLAHTSNVGADTPMLSTIAKHYELGGDAAAASLAYRALGRALRTVHAHAEAATTFAQAISLQTADQPVRADLQMELADAFLRSGGAGAANAYREAAQRYRALDRLHDAAIAAGMQGVAHARSEQNDRAIASFDEALAMLHNVSESERTRAWILFHRASTLGMNTGQFDEALAAHQEAMDLLGAHAPDDPLVFEAALALARTLLRINQLENARELLERTLPAALKSGEVWLAAELEGTLANYYNWVGDIRQSRTYTLRRQVHAEASGDLFARRHVQAWLAYIEMLGANWREAERLLDAGRDDVERLESPQPAAYHRQVTGMLALFQGRHDDALTNLMAALDGFRQCNSSALTWYIGCTAYAAYRQGNRTLADSLVSETEALLEHFPDGALPRCPSLVMLGLIAAESKNAGRASSIFPQLQPFEGQKHWVLVDRVLGVLAYAMGDVVAGARYLDRAIAQARHYGLRLDLAISLAEQARMSAQPEAERQAELRAAISRLRTLGMLGEAIRFEGYLDIPPRVEPQLEVLSPREIEVLRLMATGKTTSDIASALFISPKTVNNHITHIFQKTGLERRSEAVLFAVRQGLV